MKEAIPPLAVFLCDVVTCVYDSLQGRSARTRVVTTGKYPETEAVMTKGFKIKKTYSFDED
jgi:hypothetical protein